MYIFSKLNLHTSLSRSANFLRWFITRELVQVTGDRLWRDRIGGKWDQAILLDPLRGVALRHRTRCK